MGKPLTEESKIKDIYDNDGKLKKVKFAVELTADIFNNLIDYLLLTDKAKERNKLINELIKQELGDKVLENEFIDLIGNPYYFNKNELLEEKKVIATKTKPLSNLDEIFVVRRVPNNLDDFNVDKKSYCVGNDKHIHAGYYILPKYKDSEEKHFTFRYDSEKEEIEINLVKPNTLDILFNPLDEKKQQIKKMLILKNIIATNDLENDEITPYDIMTTFNIMYSYHLNLKLMELAEKQQSEELTDEEKAERYEIYFNGVFF